jgi:hypothetical protein
VEVLLVHALVIRPWRALAASVFEYAGETSIETHSAFDQLLREVPVAVLPLEEPPLKEQKRVLPAVAVPVALRRNGRAN